VTTTRINEKREKKTYNVQKERENLRETDENKKARTKKVWAAWQQKKQAYRRKDPNFVRKKRAKVQNLDQRDN
jgi:hypothetical protein